MPAQRVVCQSPGLRLQKQGKHIQDECGRSRPHLPSTGIGSFDVQTRQVLWKGAAMACPDGWPTAHACAENAESEVEEEAPDILPLPIAPPRTWTVPGSALGAIRCRPPAARKHGSF